MIHGVIKRRTGQERNSEAKKEEGCGVLGESHKISPYYFDNRTMKDTMA